MADFELMVIYAMLMMTFLLLVVISNPLVERFGAFIDKLIRGDKSDEDESGKD